MYNVPERKFSTKYQWYYDAKSELDMKYFQQKLRAAVLEHNKKMDKHNEAS